MTNRLSNSRSTGAVSRSLFAPWANVDLLLFGFAIALTLIAGITIRSTQNAQPYTDWWQHWVTGGVGLTIALAIARWRYENLRQWHWIVYILTIASLLAVKAIGTVGLGAQRWISIGGFNIQPSEFAKVGAIITLAAMLEGRNSSQMPEVVKALVTIGVPWGLIFLQPDLGTSLVFGAIALGMLYWANVNPGWLILMVSPLVSAILFSLVLPAWFVWVAAMTVVAWLSLPKRWLSAAVVLAIELVSGRLGIMLWDLLKDYQKDRLILFLDPSQDPLGGGYHLIQSRIAIGAGELWGRGLQMGTQTQGGFIPEQHTDFIFSAVGEEMGFIGCAIVLGLFWLVCLRLTIVAQNAKDNFGSLIAIGVLSMVFFQVTVNVSMTIGLAPVTGIPLPWMSYGRSALLTNFIAIGLVGSVSNFRQRLKF
ncbi:MAG: rod shape-determining protein RodA [Geitlerinemataceae cyanobacterium]